jgi:hypothetical protein
MHPVIVKSQAGRNAFYWNVDSPVGLHAANLTSDVLFVQWCFYKLSKWEKLPAAARAEYGKTGVNGFCTGREDDPLVHSIKVLQKEQNLMVDGRVSLPNASDVYTYHGEKHRFVIFYLNAVLRQLHPDQYPRIDLMPQFVWRIRDEATSPFI